MSMRPESQVSLAPYELSNIAPNYFAQVDTVLFQYIAHFQRIP